MKAKLRLIPLMLGILVFFTQCEKETLELRGTEGIEANMEMKAGHDDCTVTQTFWAGAGQNDTSKGYDVGTVTATVEGSMLRVTYLVESPWFLTEAHLWVGKDKKKNVFPRNAAPGQFPFKRNLDMASGTEFLVDLALLGITPGMPIYVSAHGVVEKPDGVDGLLGVLPENVTFSVQPNHPTSYLAATLTNGDWLDGVYPSYCVDPGILISLGVNYEGTLYSSYSVPDGVVDYPWNFGKVNWLLNNYSAGGEYTFADIQKTIWTLLFENPVNVGAALNPAPDMAKVNELLGLAAGYGDFVPGCGEYLVVVVRNPGVQPIIIWLPVPCGGDETAWAFGEYTFIGEGIAKKWGWIFELTCY